MNTKKAPKTPQLLNIEFYLETAAMHGEASEPDHEVGDLQQLLRSMWGLLLPEQKLLFAHNPEVQAVLDATIELQKPLAQLAAFTENGQG